MHTTLPLAPLSPIHTTMHLMTTHYPAKHTDRSIDRYGVASVTQERFGVREEGIQSAGEGDEAVDGGVGERDGTVYHGEGMHHPVCGTPSP